MLAFAAAKPGTDGARAIFGAIIGAGIISMLIAPVVSRLLPFFLGGHRQHHRHHRHHLDARRRGLGDERSGQLAQNVDLEKVAGAVEGQVQRGPRTTPVLNSVPMVNNPYAAIGDLLLAGFVPGRHPRPGQST